jgi:hypothetical protein
MSTRLATTDVIRALNDRNLQMFDDLELLENVITSVSNEEVGDLTEVFHEAIPWIEGRLERLKILAGVLDDHYWTLVNY